MANPLVPPAPGRKLFDAANRPKWFAPVPGGGHSDPPSRAYIEALDRFFDTLPAPTIPRTTGPLPHPEP